MGIFTDYMQKLTKIEDEFTKECSKEYLDKNPATEFETPKMHEDKVNLLVRKDATDSLKKPILGFNAIITELQTSNPKAAEEIMHWGALNEERMKQVMEKTSVEGTENREEKNALQEFFQFPEEIYGYLMEGAQSLFYSGKYSDALNAYSFLVMLLPEREDIWIWLGLSQQFSLDFQNAIFTYTVAVSLDPDNPFPYCYCAECWMALSGWEPAKENVAQALEKITDPIEQQALLDYCKSLESQLSER
jgi:tetratricopeptide (TPR) repeat protein